MVIVTSTCPSIYHSFPVLRLFRTLPLPLCLLWVHLRGDADDTASRAWAGVTGLLGLLVSALAEVVGASVDDDGALRICQPCG
jgi:hypothetical protein